MDAISTGQCTTSSRTRPRDGDGSGQAHRRLSPLVAHEGIECDLMRCLVEKSHINILLCRPSPTGSRDLFHLDGTLIRAQANAHCQVFLKCERPRWRWTPFAFCHLSTRNKRRIILAASFSDKSDRLALSPSCRTA